MQSDLFKYGDKTLVLSSESYRYSGHLELLKRKEIKKKIAAIEGVEPLNVEIGAFLSVDYQGKDHGRYIRKVLTEIAAIVGDAEGEIECSIYNEAEAHPSGKYFEYYSISGGQLYREPGVIVRGPKEVWG